ncbi:sigma-70 family RNA polymerase sigma factor [Candidatus Aminicenantes bacterium AC-335-A11]|jgi:RNA polymerase sigma-70 factor (ECF subfamily)|nr:sigma-70 family RNA polymerase sigma factor [SCandidatus Aminicenantes bacterium Aminicenantia_JdfR_composite]MCP2618447.1 sigma-70 family RNA polymerase sigma factor [Candidatus Aminicenantes bacterium AC-335-A11]
MTKDDKELIQKVLKGEKEAFEMLVKKYQTPIVNYLYRMTGNYNDAIDFSQEVFLKAYFSLNSYDFRYKFSAWLFKIASNLCIDKWRKKKIKTVSLNQSLKEGENFYIQVANGKKTPAEEYEKKELARKIEKTINKLSLDLKELFILRHINELSYEEIAQIKNIPIGTVKNKVFRAKEKIKKLLEKEK